MAASRPVTITTNSIIGALIVFGGAWMVWSLRDVVALIGLCVVIAAALHPMINRLERYGIPRPAGILFLYIVILGLGSIIVITFTPLVVTQLQQLTITLVGLAHKYIGGTSAQGIVTEALLNGINTVVRAVGTNVWHVLGAITIGSGGTLLAAILVYELVVDRGSFRWTVAGLIPIRYRRAFLTEGEHVEQRLSLWLRGILTVGLVIAVLAGTGLALLGVKYAFVLALIAGISEFVPLVGPYIAMIPAAAVGFSISPLTGGLVVILYYVIQQLENNFVAPKVVSQAVGLKPVVVFLAIIVGAHVAGVAGIIFAVPAIILTEALVNVIRLSRAHPAHA
jgi:predicted PurR-regulated permease PerM